MRKRLLAMSMAVLMLVGLFPTSAFAVEGDESQDVVYGTYDDGVWTKGTGNGTYTDEDTGVTLSKTAEATGNPNEYEVTLQVVTSTTETTTPPGAAATVLVIDVSGSMNYCAECGNSTSSDGVYYHHENCELSTGTTTIGKTTVGSAVQTDETRLYAAKEAAISFLDSYKGTTSGTGRYVSVVTFSTHASVARDWKDVSTKDGYNKACEAINKLSATGGTNLERGLNMANTQLTKDTVSAISADAKNVIVLTDGIPTYYGEGSGKKDTPAGPGNIGCPDVNKATADTAAKLQKSATVYTVCFGAEGQKCWNDTRECGGCDESHDASDAPTVDAFLKDSVATNDSEKTTAFTAKNTSELNKAFEAITETITSGLTGNGMMVSDPMGEGVTADMDDLSEVVTDDSDETGFTWDVSKVTPTQRTEGNTTYYTYTITYTVTIDPTEIDDFDEDAYYPLNLETTLTIPGEDGNIVLDFEVPGVKGVLPTYTVTYNRGANGHLEGENGDGNVVHSGVKHGTVTPAAPEVQADDGYYFTGWSPTVAATVTKTVTYTAQYAPKGAVTVTGKTGSVTYDGEAHDLNKYDVAGLEAGDTLTVDYTGANGTNAGTYTGAFTGTAKITAPDGKDVTYKYAVSLIHGSLTISKRAITITADSATKIYDTYPLTKNSYEITAGSLANESQEIASVTVTGSQTEVGESNNVASNAKIIDASGVDVTGNYAIKYKPGLLTVTQDTNASIVAQAYSGTYDGQSHEGITGLVLKNGKGEEIPTTGWTITYTYNGTTSSTNPQFKDAGDYPIIVSATNSNYGTVTAQSVTAHIAKCSATVASAGDRKTYDGKPLTNSTVTQTGFVEGEGVVPTVTGSQLDEGSSKNTFTYAAKEGTKLSNYEISKTEGDLIVDPITTEIVITARSDEKIYDGTALTNTGYTYTDGVLVSGDVLTAVVTGSQTDAGSSVNEVTSYKVMRGETDVTRNYTFGQSVNGLLTVTKKAVTMVSPDKAKNYDGTPLTTPASDVTVTGFVSGQGVDITMTGSRLDVGSSQNTFTYAAKEGTNLDNYQITPTYGTLTVNKATASMTVDGYEDMYDGAGHSVTVSIAANSYAEGTVWTYEYSVDGGAYSTEKPVFTDVCEHTVSVKVTNRNYNDLTGSNLVKITKRDVTLTSGTSSRPYDGTPLTNETVTTSGSGFVQGEGVERYFNFASIISEGSIDNTFEYELNADTNASNYDIKVVEGTLTVTKVSDKLVITANSASKTYDGAALTDPGYSANTGKLITGDVLSVTVEGTITDAGSVSNVVKEVKITRDGEDVTRNYDYETEDGTLTVNPKEITLTSGSASRAYNGTPLTNSTVTDNKFVAGEGATYNVTGSQTDVGTSDNEFTYTLNEGTKADNYEITPVFGTLEVTPATGEIVVTANSASKTYDGTELADDGYTVSGQLAEGDELTATVEGSQLDAGSSGNEVTEVRIMRGSKDVTANYANVKTVLGTLTVSKRTVKMTSASDSKAYDGKALTNGTVTVSGDGFVEGEGAEYDVTGAQITAGSSKNTFTYTLKAGTKADNYNISTEEGTLTVFPSTAASLSATGYTGKYDGKSHDGVTSVSVVNAVEDLNWTYTYSTDGETYTDEMPQFKDAGTYTVYVKASNPNYEDLYTTVTVTITPAVVTVTANDQSKVVGEPLPELTYTVATEVETETPAFTGELAYVGDDTRGVHTDEITQGTLALTDGEGFKASNYTLVFVPGTLTIHARGMQVEKTVDKTRAEVGNELVYTITVTNTGDVDLTDVVITDPMLNVEKNIGTLAPGAVWTESFTYKVQSSDAGKTIVNTVIAKAADGTEDEAVSPGTEITRPSTGGGGVLNTKDHYSYIIGYKDGNVRPYGTVTRGEVATIFFRLLTDEARDKYWSQENDYSDCGPDLWCNNAISTLSNMGIISGYADGTFRPYAKITRAQFAKIAVGFFETTTKEYQGYYTDVPEDAWYTDYVEAASRVGLIQGFQDGSFRPNENITRAQACVIVNRALNRTPNAERLLPESKMITWPDCTPDDWFYADIQEATNSHDYTMITVKGEKVEKWSAKLPQRDWAAFEHAWSTAHSAPGGEVVK